MTAITTEQRSDNPVQLDFPLNKTCLTIREKCGQCLFFKRMAYPAYKQPCVEKGIIEESKPCKAFSANPQKLSFKNNKHVHNVAKAIQELSPEDLRMMAAILNREERTRRYGFQFGENVYFLAFGGDYLSNYLCAKVVFADATYVHVQGSDGVIATLYHKSVLKERQWEKKRQVLLRDNKQVDPKLPKYTRAPTKREKDIRAIIDKVIPTLTAESKETATLSVSNPRKISRFMPLDEFTNAQMLLVR